MIILKQNLFASAVRVVSPKTKTGRELIKIGNSISTPGIKVADKETMLTIRRTTKEARNVTGAPTNAVQHKGTTVVSYYNGEGFKSKRPRKKTNEDALKPKLQHSEEVQGMLGLNWGTTALPQKLPKQETKPRKVLVKTKRKLDKKNDRVIGNKYTLDSKGNISEVPIDPELNLGQHVAPSQSNIKRYRLNKL